MTWVVANTSSDSQFLILTSTGAAGAWWEDRASEWFPVLAARTSLNTVQGSEWLAGRGYILRKERAKSLHHCAEADASCVDNWAREGNATFTHIYIAKDRQRQGRTALGCCHPLVRSLNDASGYALVYNGPGAVIYARLGVADTASAPNFCRRGNDTSDATCE
jgi:hypothetical protein